jgi:hypothetical protein
MDLFDRFRPIMHPPRPQEDRLSRPQQKKQKRLLSPGPADSVTSSPAPPNRKSTTTRSPSTYASSSKHSALSRNLSRHTKNHDSAAETIVDSVNQSPSCSSANLSEDTEMSSQHDTKGGGFLRSGYHKIKNTFSQSKPTSVRGTARTKAEALQGQTRAGSTSRHTTSVTRPSSQRSSSSRIPAGTVIPGEYMHTPPQFTQPPQPVNPLFIDENMPPPHVNIAAYGGHAARAAAADANNSRRKFERRDSQTGAHEYVPSNRDSGLNMSSDDAMDLDEDHPRKVSLIKPSSMLDQSTYSPHIY